MQAGWRAHGENARRPSLLRLRSSMPLELTSQVESRRAKCFAALITCSEWSGKVDTFSESEPMGVHNWFLNGPEATV